MTHTITFTDEELGLLSNALDCFFDPTDLDGSKRRLFTDVFEKIVVPYVLEEDRPTLQLLIAQMREVEDQNLGPRT